MIKPRRLAPGSRIRLVAPSSSFKKEAMEKGIHYLTKLGFEVSYDKRILKQDFMFAGKDNERLAVLKEALLDDTVDGIWCLRGGYGAGRLLPDLVKLKKPKKPKFFIGFSDITFLHVWLLQHWNWVCFHGPMATRLGSADSSAGELLCVRKTAMDPQYRLQVNRGLQSLGARKRAQGTFTGGNLTIVEKTLATDWEIDTRGKVLFLEEVGDRAYMIDRNLVHLEQAGKFDHVKAVVLGTFTECFELDGRERYMEILKRFFKGAPFPVITGFRAGHDHKTQLTVPLGVKVAIDTKGPQPCLEVLESCVE